GGCLARQRERGGGRGGGGLEKGTAVDGHGTVSRVTGSRHLNLAGRWSVGNVDGPPFLRGRETGRSIWGASCGCDEFRGTLCGGIRGYAYSPVHAGTRDDAWSDCRVRAAAPNHRPGDVDGGRRP